MIRTRFRRFRRIESVLLNVKQPGLPFSRLRISKLWVYSKTTHRKDSGTMLSVRRLLLTALTITFASFVVKGVYINADIPNSKTHVIADDWISAIKKGDLILAQEVLERNFIDLEPGMIMVLSKTYLSTGNALKAEQLIQRIRESSHDLDKPALQAIAMCTEARILIGRGRTQEAKTLAFSCYDLLIYSQTTIDRDLAAEAAHIIGLSFHEEGDYSKALSWYSTSRTLRLPSSWYFEIGLAATLNNVGNVLWKQGYVYEALAMHHNSLALKEEVLGSNHIDLAASLNNIGVILAELEDHEAALAYHSRAFNIRNHVAPKSRAIAHSYHNLAWSFEQLGEHSKALPLVNRALKIKQSTFSADHYEVINSLSLYAQVRSSLGDYSESDSIYTSLISRCVDSMQDICNDIFVDYLNQLSKISEPDSINKSSKFVYSFVRKSKSTGDMPNIDLTSAYVRQMLSIAPDHELCLQLEDAIRIHWNLTGRDIGLDARSHTNIRRPVYLVRQLILLSECLAAVSENKQSDINLYGRILDLSKTSLELLEREYSKELPIVPPNILNRLARAAALSGLWARTHDRQPNDSIFFEEDILLLSDYATNWSFQSAMYDLKALRLAGATESEIHTLALSLINYFLPTTELERNSEDVLDMAFEDHRSSRSELLQRYPLFNVFRPRHRAFDLRKLKRHLENTESTLVLYENIRDSTYAIVFNDKYVELVKLDDKSTTETLTTSIGALKRIETMQEVELLHSGYEYFLQPLEALTTNKDILVVRNEVVEQVPFESLISSLPIDSSATVRYAIQDKGFSYSFSISGVVESEPFYNGLSDGNKLLAVYPDFGSGTKYSDELVLFAKSVMQNAFDSSEIFSELPGAKQEVQEIAGLFSGSSKVPRWLSGQVDILSTNQPVESTLKSSDTKEYSHIHLATHSFVGAQKHAQSGIVLEANGQNGEDGILRIEEVFSLELDADLVVLSSCEAASGKISSDSSLNSFAKGFMFAGAENLVASLWQSDDFATLILMRNFYAHLQTNHSISEALRLAKLDLLEMGGPIANPYYWAGFIHIGAPSRIRKAGA